MSAVQGVSVSMVSAVLRTAYASCVVVAGMLVLVQSASIVEVEDRVTRGDTVETHGSHAEGHGSIGHWWHLEATVN